MLSEHLESVRQRIGAACQRSGRDPSSVTLVCVTKGLPPDVIQQAVALGVTDIGENRVQEARTKQLVLGSRFKVQGGGLEPSTVNLEPIRWHLVGHLQRNKAKDAVELFEVIHSLDSLSLAAELERHAAKKAQGSRFPGPPSALAGTGKVRGQRNSLEPPTLNLEPLEVFIQVNVSGEATKFGCKPEEVPELAHAVLQLPHLRLRGLMTIAPFHEDPEQARPHFRHLRQLRDDLMAQLPVTNYQLQLSMGMSQDFEVAIEEGADLVRIGTAIFRGMGQETGDRGQETRNRR